MPDFNETIEELSGRSRSAQRRALTEEATKTAVILPFIQALGFDIFSLDEVIPEFVADVGVKKGEKVDFALRMDGKVAMLIEAKPISSNLGDTQYNQLFRYFTVTDARLAILTNGREAWFFSDTEEPNKMDRKPFFTFDFQKYDKDQVRELARFQKGSFAIDSIIEAASNLKYTRDAANFLKRQLDNPDEEFVRLVGKQIHDGSMTKSIVEQIKPAIQAALDAIVRDRIQDKLSITFQESKPSPHDAAEPEQSEPEDGIVTTDEELEGYRIIRAIAARHAPVEKVTIRDAKSYCAILFEDNNRKPICRLYFNSPTTKKIGIFSPAKEETRIPVEGPADLYSHCDAIETVVRSYIE